MEINGTQQEFQTVEWVHRKVDVHGLGQLTEPAKICALLDEPEGAECLVLRDRRRCSGQAGSALDLNEVDAHLAALVPRIPDLGLGRGSLPSGILQYRHPSCLA